MDRKHLFTVGVMCCALYFNAQAQLSPPSQKLLPAKTFLFNKLPDQFDVGDLWLQKLFDGPDTGSVKIPLNTNSFFEGVISEKMRVNPNVVNINIRSSNYDGALLSISKITYNDLKVKYIGRIVSIRYGDVFLLTQENNTIRFKKQKQSVVITE